MDHFITNHVDETFIKMCRNIIKNGFSSEGQEVRPRWEDGTPAHTIKARGTVVNRYGLSKGLPLTTLRKTNWRAAIDEILWIFQKKSNNINELNSKIWNQWADEEGSIGKAYGYQLGVKHKYTINGEEVWMDQVDKMLYDLKHTPYSRRIMTNIYTFADLDEMNLHPCAFGVVYNVCDGKLNVTMTQRSQDILAANNWNVVQYSALAMMVAQVSGLEVGEFVHVITDAHIYDRHVEKVEELINRMPYPAPVTKLDPTVTNFYDFTVDSFVVEGYDTVGVHYGEQIKGIPIAV